MKRIGITGGTGFVGRNLTALLIRKGYEVVVFTTRVGKQRKKQHIQYAHWNPENGACDLAAIKSLDVMVNLAGEGIADKRWREKRKKEIRDSRVKSTDFLVSHLNAYAPDCKALITASAIGFYGSDNHYSESFSETSSPATDFLGETCRQWEASSEKLSADKRRVVLRFGIVLGKGSGAFPQLANPLSYGIAPILGSGGQVVSWIEIHDLARLILYAIEHTGLAGIYNAVAPGHVSHRQLMHTIAEVKGGVKIPLHVPSALLKILLGEMSSEVLKSCTVSAEKILNAGFVFDHPDIDSAVRAILHPGVSTK